MNQEKIKDTDLTIGRNFFILWLLLLLLLLRHYRLENLDKMVVDKWDLETLIQFAQEQVFQDYQYDIDRAVEDAEDYTLEELDNDN